MEASNSSVKAAAVLTQGAVRGRNGVAVYADLFKARLTLLVLLTTLTGFYVASSGPVDFGLMFHAVFGTALVASGAAAFNQLLEREHDARMRRTRERPLPSGELTARRVFWVAAVLSALGVVWLALLVNLLSASLAFISWFLYVLVYTPLKRVTWLNTAVGAIPGGLPPLIGWVAARGEFGAGITLFAILAFWQIPHFLAIAWMFREEYAKAGFVMLPKVDPTGRRTSSQSVLTAAALFAVSALPFALGIAGVFFLVGALILGFGFLWLAVRFRQTLGVPEAKQLFFASIIYLPAVLGLLVWDKIST